MDHDREPQPGTIKVVDRRRFTASGDVREGVGPLSETPRKAPPPQDASRGPQRAAPGHPSAPPAAAEPRAPRADDARRHDHHHDHGADDAPGARGSRDGAPAGQTKKRRMDFLPFIASLATNAMAALGMLPDAERQGMPRNPAMAREYIDIIVMLQERTEGNLSPEEAQTLARLINDLQMQYVELTRSVQPATMAPPPPPHLR